MTHIDDPSTQRANVRYIQGIMRMPLLARAREFELARRWRDEQDEGALHELILSYTRLVVSTASRFRGYGLPLGDLIQEGNIGLMQAAARFEPEREIRFSTYAAWWIRAAMQEFILRNWSIVRTGTTAGQKLLFFNLRRLRARIAGPNGDPLGSEGRDAIARELRVDAAEVEAMDLRLSGGDQSLSVPVSATDAGSSGEERANFIADLRPSPEDVVIGMRDAATRSRWLAEALGELSDRERVIIARRRLEEDGATLEQLGSELGVSKERIRQLESRALNKLRVSMLKRAGDVRLLL
ncbi:RNA polymerase factor sigma-32 [Rhodospirillaceae bacterium SYSU D60014]|uniref:RNA polymerase factor sigma-32 n=1 Tax=Virgifigura deserti TaxID=2268457 RepID=UPI000E672562